MTDRKKLIADLRTYAAFFSDGPGIFGEAADLLASSPQLAVGEAVRWEARVRSDNGWHDWTLTTLAGVASMRSSPDFEVRALGVIEPAREGFVMVPIEPTLAMLDAADEAGTRGYTGTWTVAPASCWKAMVTAATQPQDTPA